MFQWGQTPLSYPCIRAIKTATLLVVQNCPGTGLYLRIRYSHVNYHPSVRTKHHHKERIKNFFLSYSTNSILCGLLELHSTRKHKVHVGLFQSKPSYIPLIWMGHAAPQYSNFPFQTMSARWISGKGKGVLFCLATWIFMALLYYASIGFTDL